MSSHRLAPSCLGAAFLILPWLLVTAPAWGSQDAWSGGGPEGGWITALLRPYGPSGDLFAGTFGGGVWRSTDQGETWVDLTSNLGGTVIGHLAYATGQSPTLYAGTDEAGLYASPPPYARWTPMNTGIPNSPLSVQGIAVHPGSPDVVTVATSSGVFTSDRGGAFWPLDLQWLIGFPFADVEVHPLAAARIHALQLSDLYVTDDFGRTIHRYGRARGLPDDLLQDLELWPSSLDTLFVVSRSRGVYRSDPGPIFSYAGPAEKPVGNPILYELKVVPQTRELLLGGADGLYVSKDVGHTWRKLDDGLGTSHQEIWSILVDDPSAGRWMLGSFRCGFLKTAAGGAPWRESNAGLRASLVNGVWAKDDRVLAATAHGKVFLSDDRGATWQDRTGDLDILQAHDVHVLERGRWLVPSTDGLWMSDDEGATWREPSIAPPRIAYTIESPSWWPQDHLLVGTWEGVYRTEDGGDTWTVLDGVPTNAAYMAIGAAPADQTLWMAARGDALYAGSIEQGFVRVPSAPLQSRAYFDLSFADGASQSVLVAADGGLFRFDAQVAGNYISTDVGLGLPATSFERGPAVMGVEWVEGEIFVGLAELGVFWSSDGGATWSDYGDGIAVPRVQELIRVEGSSRLCVATWGSGVYQRKLPDAVPVLMQGPRLTQSGRTVVVEATTAQRVDASLWRSIEGGASVSLWAGSIDGVMRYVDDLSSLGLASGTRVRYRLQLRGPDGSTHGAGAEIAYDAGAFVPPLQTRLLPAWPNPFNPRVNLAVELAAPGRIRLSVFDVRGRRVETILDGPRDAGRHEFSWRGRDDRDMPAPSGVYLVQLEVEERVVSRQRITLLR